ncbi:MAG: PD40 domain-containing protein [Xanthomonadales bacterium]|nr:PD40 domain-containing protein [Xanthomonadales bacterium]
MLKSHKNLLEPRPSDRLRIGDRIVDIPLREIAPATGGDAMRVTLKSLGVLLTLVAHSNKLVSREALLEWVWPDTLPGDDVVTQAITQLRRALGDDREQSRYIETLAKQGYRLIAPVEWLIDEVIEAPAEGPADVEPVAISPQRAATRRRWPWALAAVGSVLVLVAAVAYWRGDRDTFEQKLPVWPVSVIDKVASPPYLRIASLPMSEEKPTLSPDGSLVAYTRSVEGAESAVLMLQTSAAVSPRALTEPVEKQFDLMPAWSPDGRQIAFVRIGGDRCLVMAIPAAGGAARELGECIGGEAHSLAWFPDGKALVGAGRAKHAASPEVDKPAVDKALYRMALDGGRWERIAYTKAPSDEDLLPAVSPDGRWIAFQRNVSLADLWRIPAGGGEAQRLTDLRTNIYGLAWTPDSSGLLFARYIDGKVVMSKLSLQNGRISDYLGGDNSVMYPSVSKGAGVVAFEVEETRSRVRRVAVADGAKAMSTARVLFDSAGSSLLPSIAPDGRQVMFVSDRTGDMRLWWLDQSRPETLRSFDAYIPVPRYPVMWNADSRRALAIGRTADHGVGIYELDPQRGLANRLPAPEGLPVHAAYHPDPDRLLVVADHGEGRLGVTLYDRSGVPWRALATVDDVAVAVVDLHHRRIVLASMSKPEIRSADLDLGNVRTIDRVTIQRRNRTLVPTSGGVRVMDSDARCFWRWRWVAVDRTDGTGQDAPCLGDIDWYLEAVTYDPGLNVIYLSSIEEMDNDIGLAPLPSFTDAKP